MADCYITISNEQDTLPVDTGKLEQLSCKMLTYAVTNPKITDLSELRSYNLDDTTITLDLLIWDDKKIREINREYRGIDKATDVLSFALFADNPDSRLIIDNEISLGEIIISIETAIRQAEENNKTLEEELYFLLSHGILHLFGFDHQSEESLEFMLNLQDELIQNSV